MVGGAAIRLRFGGLRASGSFTVTHGRAGEQAIGGRLLVPEGAPKGDVAVPHRSVSVRFVAFRSVWCSIRRSVNRVGLPSGVRPGGLEPPRGVSAPHPIPNRERLPGFATVAQSGVRRGLVAAGVVCRWLPPSNRHSSAESGAGVEPAISPLAKVAAYHSPTRTHSTAGQGCNTAPGRSCVHYKIYSLTRPIPTAGNTPGVNHDDEAQASAKISSRSRAGSPSFRATGRMR